MFLFQDYEAIPSYFHLNRFSLPDTPTTNFHCDLPLCLHGLYNKSPLACLPCEIKSDYVDMVHKDHKDYLLFALSPYVHIPCRLPPT